MDRRERIGDPEEMLRIAAEGAQSKLWTALPGIIQSFDPAAMTCTVQPAITAVVRDETGEFSELALPLLLDCPVVFQGGGGVTLTFPITEGDECLVVFSARCIDSWWQLGDVQGQAELRMHDLSDGFVLAGVRSQPRAFDVDTSSAQLRSDDGAAYVSVNPSTHEIKATTSGNITAHADGTITATSGGNMSATAGGNISATASGSATITAPSITLNGNVTINGTLAQTGGNATMSGSLAVTGDVTAGGKSLKTHTHTDSRGGTTSPPN